LLAVHGGNSCDQILDISFEPALSPKAHGYAVDFVYLSGPFRIPFVMQRGEEFIELFWIFFGEEDRFGKRTMSHGVLIFGHRKRTMFEGVFIFGHCHCSFSCFTDGLIFRQWFLAHVASARFLIELSQNNSLTT
jgi:hypothetical protein